MIDELIRDLKRHEGYRKRLYKDSVGKLTIGVGHNIEDNGLDDPAIEIQLKIDINRALEDCEMLFPNFYSISENRQRVLANMAFNLGYDRLKSFKKLAQAVYNEDFNIAADEMLDSKWAGQVGTRAIELAELMRNDE